MFLLVLFPALHVRNLKHSCQKKLPDDYQTDMTKVYALLDEYTKGITDYAQSKIKKLRLKYRKNLMSINYQ